MNKTTGKFSPEIRARAVRLVLEHEGDHPSRWQAILSVAPKIGCSAQTLNEWIKKSETDNGRRAGVPSDMAAKMKALERENRELRQVTLPPRMPPILGYAVLPQRRDADAQEPFQRRADHRGPEGTRRRAEHGRFVPEARE